MLRTQRTPVKLLISGGCATHRPSLPYSAVNLKNYAPLRSNNTLVYARFRLNEILSEANVHLKQLLQLTVLVFLYFYYFMINSRLVGIIAQILIKTRRWIQRPLVSSKYIVIWSFIYCISLLFIAVFIRLAYLNRWYQKLTIEAVFEV